jgi:hypothetical protein
MSNDPDDEPLDADLHSPETYRQASIWELMYLTNLAIKKNKLIPSEEHDLLLSLLSAIDLSIAEHRFSTIITERGYESKLPNIRRERALEIYKLAYGLATKMRGTPLLYAQRAGDRRELAEFIRSEQHLSGEMRQYIADLVEKKTPARERNKPPSAEIARRNRTLVWFILRARASGADPDASIDAAVERFDAGGRRNVQEIFRVNKEREPELLAATELAIERMRELGRDLEAIAN